MDSLVTLYRTLYWEHNEYQLIGTRQALEAATALERRMAVLVAKLGYIPAP